MNRALVQNFSFYDLALSYSGPDLRGLWAPWAPLDCGISDRAWKCHDCNLSSHASSQLSVDNKRIELPYVRDTGKASFPEIALLSPVVVWIVRVRKNRVTRGWLTS
jgi:hypothetical protein